MSPSSSVKVFVALLALACTAVPLTAGSITGTVQVSGASRGGAVVYIDAIEGASFEPPAESVVMDQTGKVFVPRVLPILVGTTVDFLNSDPFSHNVFSPDPCPEQFDLGGWAAGEVRSHTFTEPCVAVILCNVHPEMDAYVLAVETPYFAVSGEDGSYAIKDLPDGTYTVAVWHERLKKRHTQPITVSGATTQDFSLSR